MKKRGAEAQNEWRRDLVRELWDGRDHSQESLKDIYDSGCLIGEEV